MRDGPETGGRNAMSRHFDALETRSADRRAAEQLAAVNAQIARVAAQPGACRCCASPT